MVSRGSEEHDRLVVPAAAHSALNGKVAALMGASRGLTGTARGQSQLRQSFVFTNTYLLLQPEILVGHAHEKFDADGRLVHEATRDILTVFLQALQN